MSNSKDLKAYLFTAEGSFLFDDGSARTSFEGTVYAYSEADATELIYEHEFFTPDVDPGESFEVDIDAVHLSEFEEDPDELEACGRGIVEYDCEDPAFLFKRYSRYAGWDYCRHDYDDD